MASLHGRASKTELCCIAFHGSGSFTTLSPDHINDYGRAIRIRVSNELGAGNLHAARMASYAAMALTLAESVVISTILLCYRHVFGYAYSSDKDVVISVAKMVPLMCLSIIMDSLHVVLNGLESRAWGSNLIMEEVKKVILIAAPVAVVTVSRYLLQLVAVMMAGHLGELPLSGVALATSFANVTGFSVLNFSFLSSLTITTLHFLIPFSIASAASFRISNELGAWNPHAVPITVTVALILNTVEVIIVSMILFFCRQYIGYAYTTSKEVVNYTAELIPLLCLMLIADSLQAILSGNHGKRKNIGRDILND
ncbi:Multi antimicrobial extrusion protein [Corchorus olitorius]|uniref:Multi antimicrobial extrusion protein n=1 Tax=Corchorus olitorius TaxID=93759 RepID=A0A1R3HSC1_9ROSI|nr:Multi antimicrobial extrusion protein [Corchorus olitorius]